MKVRFLSLLVAFLACLPLQWAMANENADCPDNSCFDTRLVSEQKDGDCTTYTLEISQDGSCRYALSHFSLEVSCGRITDVSNSGGWAMAVGTTDPTTGITGIKVDDIKNFGESGKPQSFTLTYTVCGADCENTYPEKVAYKASTCVHYDEIVKPYVPMALDVQVKDVNCSGGTDGAADLTIAGGKAPYSILWSNGATTEDLAAIAAGVYGVKVTDAAGEEISIEAVVAAPLVLSLAAEVKDASCNGNGAISLSTQGGTAPYVYKWSNGEATSAISAAAGIYTVTVSDANNCSASATYTIVEAGSLAVSISGGESCGDNLLSALVEGGAAPYTYSWSTGESTAAITAVEGGTINITITDANGCSATAQKEVVVGGALSLQLTATNPACAYGSNGSIDLMVEGGSGNYTYSWSTGAVTEDLNGLKAGSYAVTVADAAGCTATASVSVSNPQSVFVRHTKIVQPDCNGGLGSISVEAFYGTAPYSYQWNTGDTTAAISALEADVYRVTVTDANGCSSSRSFTINEAAQPSVSIAGGSCSSTLTANVSGGTAPYTYEWTNGDTSSIIEITTGGDYGVTVTDANGCSSTATISAGDPGTAIQLDAEVISPTCYGGANGSIDLSIDGGDGNNIISWSNGATTEDLDSLAAGTYTVTVSNESGCSASQTFSISAPQAIFIRPLEVKNVSCTGEAGSISVEAYFGTSPYTYQWDNGAEGASIEGLESGYYTVVVTDANGCSNSRRYAISEEAAPAVSIQSDGCGDSFKLSANVSGGVAPYTYSWSNGGTSQNISAAAGDHWVTVTDASGCSNTAEITVEGAGTPLQLAAEVVHVSCAGGSNGSAILTVNGGVAPYTYDWSNGATGAAAQELEAGTYSVQVKDAAGCSGMLAFTVAQPAALSVAAVVENSASCGLPSGSIAVEVNGGTPPYSFIWNTGAVTQNLQSLAAGNYTLTVEDANTCVAIRSYIIEGLAAGAAPTASMGACADTVICRGVTASLPVYFTGEGPYMLSYTDGNITHSVTTSANPYMLEVSPNTVTSYALSGVSNSCGEGTVSGRASIQVSDCSKGQVCEDPCFSTQVVSRQVSGSCQSITLQVNTDGDCRYALSHFNVAVGCGRVSNASNSKGWPMELNALDPTTGLYGIKVDEIKNFGEGKGAQSFTVTYTLCSEELSCMEAATACGPLVAYKAGSCVYYDKASEEEFIAEQPENTEVAQLHPDYTLYPNPYKQGQVLNLEIADIAVEGNATLTIRSITGLQLYKEQLRVSPSNPLIGIELPNIPAGLYVVTLEMEGHTITKQLYVW